MGYFEEKVADKEKEIEKIFDEIIEKNMTEIRELASNVKEDYMLVDCVNCDWLYDCDNMFEETTLIECTTRKLIRKFKNQIIEECEKLESELEW